MNVGSIQSLLDSLGPSLAGADYDVNRERTRHADRLRQMAAQRIASSKGIAESLAGQGMAHSGVHNQQQINLNKQMNEQMASMDQSFTDRLTSLARQRIQQETQFNVNALMPR